MKVARYWARETCTADDQEGYPVMRTVLRSSDVSLDDARHKAKRACEQMAQNIRAGFKPDWYEYDRQSKPEPIEREWLSETGQRVAAITINRHGIPVLNTRSLVFVDVDLPEQKRRGIFGALCGDGHAPTEETALDSFRQWTNENSSRSARAYRTAGGLRYLITHPAIDPTSRDTEHLMQTLGADEMYARLCKHQACFRARLSAKPWRIGCKAVNVNAANEPQDPAPSDALKAYREKAAEYAVCEFIEEIGPKPRDAMVSELVRVHDEQCAVGSGLPLA